MKILVVGFTHLGLVYSTCFASKGFEVSLAASKFEEKVDREYLSLRAEPFLHENIMKAKNERNLAFVDIGEIQLDDFNLIFVAEDTQLDPSGFPLHSEISTILSYIDSKNLKDLPIILMSQVYPGFCRSTKMGNNLIYWVETLVFGRAIERATNPEQIVLGFQDSEFIVPDAVMKLLKSFSSPINVMSWESAELTKIAFNFMLSLSVLGANFLATVAEHSHADWTDVRKALQLDSRIGRSAYLNPGLGISGGNLPRDLNTLKIMMLTMPSSHATFLEEIIAYNDSQFLWVRDCIEIFKSDYGLPLKNTTFGILGLTYKAGTSSTLNSPAIKLAKFMSHINFLAFDPEVEDVTSVPNIETCTHIVELFERSDILILLTPWQEIIEELINSEFDFKSKFLIDAGAWIETDTLKKFRDFKQRGKGLRVK
jgi:UDPglucose 6-dehydrogenase